MQRAPVSTEKRPAVSRDAAAREASVWRYWLFAASLLGLFLASYLIVAALEISVLSDPMPVLEDRKAVAAPIGVALLVADAFVPIPSSVVMVGLGAFFGAPLAIALGLLGRVGMAAVGFAAGRRSGALVERLVSPAERARADELLRRHGALAIVISRPVPILAETVAVLAGTSSLSWRRALLAAAVGSLPEVVAYALAGAVAASFENAAVIWVSLIGVVALCWVAIRRADHEPPNARPRA